MIVSLFPLIFPSLIPPLHKDDEDDEEDDMDGVVVEIGMGIVSGTDAKTIGDVMIAS